MSVLLLSCAHHANQHLQRCSTCAQSQASCLNGNSNMATRIHYLLCLCSCSQYTHAHTHTHAHIHSQVCLLHASVDLPEDEAAHLEDRGKQFGNEGEGEEDGVGHACFKVRVVRVCMCVCMCVCVCVCVCVFACVTCNSRKTHKCSHPVFGTHKKTGFAATHRRCPRCVQSSPLTCTHPVNT
jgi:hypothetical protein